MNDNFDIKLLFGQKVKNYRIIKNVSQEELSNLTGLHRTYISEVERGLRNISLENIHLISQALEVRMSELLDFEHQNT